MCQKLTLRYQLRLIIGDIKRFKEEEILNGEKGKTNSTHLNMLTTVKIKKYMSIMW